MLSRRVLRLSRAGRCGWVLQRGVQALPKEKAARGGALGSQLVVPWGYVELVSWPPVPPIVHAWLVFEVGLAAVSLSASLVHAWQTLLWQTQRCFHGGSCHWGWVESVGRWAITVNTCYAPASWIQSAWNTRGRQYYQTYPQHAQRWALSWAQHSAGVCMAAAGTLQQLRCCGLHCAQVVHLQMMGAESGQLAAKSAQVSCTQGFLARGQCQWCH